MREGGGRETSWRASHVGVVRVPGYSVVKNQLPVRLGMVGAVEPELLAVLHPARKDAAVAKANRRKRILLIVAPFDLTASLDASERRRGACRA